MKKMTLVNITGQDLILKFIEKKKGKPLEPVILEAHGEMEFPEKEAKELMEKHANVLDKSTLKPKKK